MKGAELQTWRKARGWKQSDLMKELGVTARQTITNWENCETVPHLVQLAVIALDQVEACNRNAGLPRQFTPETIANMWFSPLQGHIEDVGVEGASD